MNLTQLESLKTELKRINGGDIRTSGNTINMVIFNLHPYVQELAARLSAAVGSHGEGGPGWGLPGLPDSGGTGPHGTGPRLAQPVAIGHYRLGLLPAHGST